jgi:hypothetical protein
MILTGKASMKSIVLLALLPLTLLGAACSHQPVLPEAKNVTVKREDAPSGCREIGRVLGQVRTTAGSIEQAVDDMKLDAARKGANYVRMESTGAMGTSASGTAYQCP